MTVMQGSLVDDIVERLRDHGLRATTPRRIIVETLLDQPDHVTADRLTELVQVGAPHVNKATVYRTLEALEALGVVDRMPLDQGPAQWHLADHTHQHLVCITCGDITEIASKEFGRLARTLANEYGFEADMRHIAISGRCARCTAAQAAGGNLRT
jgi:Fur family ferric uptake transcriptional regulator